MSVRNDATRFAEGHGEEGQPEGLHPRQAK